MADMRISKASKRGNNHTIFIPTAWSNAMKLPEKGSTRVLLTKTGRRKMEVEFL